MNELPFGFVAVVDVGYVPPTDHPYDQIFSPPEPKIFEISERLEIPEYEITCEFRNDRLHVTHCNWMGEPFQDDVDKGEELVAEYVTCDLRLMWFTDRNAAKRWADQQYDAAYGEWEKEHPFNPNISTFD